MNLDDFPFDKLLKTEKGGTRVHGELVIEVMDYIVVERRMRGQDYPDENEMKLVEQVLKIYKKLGYIKGRWIRTGSYTNDPFTYFVRIGGLKKDTVQELMFKVGIIWTNILGRDTR